METNKKVKYFLKKHFYKVRFVIIILVTIIMFYAYYFSDRPATLETLIKDSKQPRMYLCLLFSFGTALLIGYIIGAFNKENVKKMTTLNENKK